MFSSHAIDPVIDSRSPSDQQSPSFEWFSSLPATVPTPGRQIDAAGLPDHAILPLAEPLVRTPRPCTIDTSRRQSSCGDDTTYFDDEYQAIHSSNLRATDYDGNIHTMGDPSRARRFNGVEMNGRDHQLGTSDDKPTTKSATLTCDPTIVLRTYTSFQSGPPQYCNTSEPDVMHDIQAMGAAPAQSSYDDLQCFTPMEMTDTSSVSCSKAYATGGAVNQDIESRPVMPQATHRSRLSGKEKERYAKPWNLHSDGVQPEQLPFLMKAVGQLSADADSTVPGRPVVRPETSIGSTIGCLQASEAQPFLKARPPETPITEPSLTPAPPTYGTSSQHHAWLTPPPSSQSSPQFRTIDEISFSSQHPVFPSSPNTSPEATHTVLSPPKTPISGSPLNLRKDLLDRIPFHPFYSSRTQPREYATPHSTSNILPPTGLTHTPNTNAPDLSPFSIPNTPTYVSIDNSFPPPTPESILCEVCQKSFHGSRATRLRSLKRHTETNHRGEAYECVYCNERLSRSDYRIRHLESKTHGFQFPPTPKSRKRDPELELFLRNSFRKIEG